MAAGDPLAQFRPVSLHPPASLHPAASCVTSPATLDHPRLQRPPLLQRQRSHSRRGSAPLCRGGKEDRREESAVLLVSQTLRAYLGRLSSLFRLPSLTPHPLFPAIRDIFTRKVVRGVLKEIGKGSPDRRIV